MGSSFGQFFKISTFGESHGKALGVIIDGVPAGLQIKTSSIQKELDRRKPGQSSITTPRKEKDQVEILSGIFEERSSGTPISLLIRNKDAKSTSYNHMKNLYRPGHADFTYDARYGFRDWRGGGRASNRETTARVAAGAIAGALIRELANIETLAWVEQVYKIKARIDPEQVTREQIEDNIVRCPDPDAAKKMITLIKEKKREGNSVGGLIKFYVTNCPAGLGDPVFDKLTAEIAKGIMSIPATRSISFGMGEEAIDLTGEEHNDLFSIAEDQSIITRTNRAGGILGGISNGQAIEGKVSFKPTATILKTQQTVDQNGKLVDFQGKGRHDPCVLPRAVPIVESMINLVLADHLLRYSVASIERLKKIFH